MNRFALILMMMMLTSPSFAQNKVEFLFSQDNQNNQTNEQFRESIKPKSLIKENEWLNAPMTRLDYVLMTIEAELNKSASQAALNYVPHSFEPQSEPFARRARADFVVRYNESIGRLILRGEIRDVGKPKKPMKEYCESMLSFISGLYPAESLGYLWQNTALGVLLRDNSANPIYVDAADRLARSAVYLFNIQSVYKVGDKNAMFTMSCSQQENKGQIAYQTFSDFLTR